MIEYITGNLLEANAEALVNAVNCVGVMGKGIALQFKMAYPENFNQYQDACKKKQVNIGEMLICRLYGLENPRYIINFPTKNHWRESSHPESIRLGLRSLTKEVVRLKIQSIAIPALGCGNGGLSWDSVNKIIKEELPCLPEVMFLIYTPLGVSPQSA